MVSTRLISKSSSPYTNPLMTVLRAPITICIIVTFIFHSFFRSLTRPRYLSFFLLSFYFTLWSARTAKSTIRQLLFFCCCWLSQGLVVWPKLGDLYICQNPREICASHFPGQIPGCAYTICSCGQINAHFSVDHLSLPVVSRFILFRC